MNARATFVTFVAGTIIIALTGCGPETPAPAARPIEWLAPTRIVHDTAGDPVERLVHAYEPTPTRTPVPATPTPVVATPTPAPYRPPAPVPGNVAAASGGGDVHALIAAYPWPVAQALAVASCESGFRNVQNAGGGPYYGPFQVGIFHFRPGEDHWDVATNVAVAFRIWSREGWAPWECSPY